LHLFALVKARKQDPGSFDVTQEFLIAHYQAKVCGEPNSLEDQPELKFYDITEQLTSGKDFESPAEGNMLYSLVYDACSFTLQSSGLHILLLVSQTSKQGIFVQMDGRVQTSLFKTIGLSGQASRILGVKLSSEEELVEPSSCIVNLTIMTTGQVYIYLDLQRTFVGVRQAEPLSLTRIQELAHSGSQQQLLDDSKEPEITRTVHDLNREAQCTTRFEVQQRLKKLLMAHSEATESRRSATEVENLRTRVVQLCHQVGK